MVECDYEEIKNIIRDVIKEEFSKKTSELQKTVKKERKKSQWQLFLKECIRTKKSLPFKERIKACSGEWKKKKSK